MEGSPRGRPGVAQLILSKFFEGEAKFSERVCVICFGCITNITHIPDVVGHVATRALKHSVAKTNKKIGIAKVIITKLTLKTMV